MNGLQPIKVYELLVSFVYLYALKFYGHVQIIISTFDKLQKLTPGCFIDYYYNYFIDLRLISK